MEKLQIVLFSAFVILIKNGCHLFFLYKGPNSLCAFHTHRYILDITASALYIRKLRFKNLIKFELDLHLKNTEAKLKHWCI